MQLFFFLLFFLFFFLLLLLLLLLLLSLSLCLSLFILLLRKWKLGEIKWLVQGTVISILTVSRIEIIKLILEQEISMCMCVCVLLYFSPWKKDIFFSLDSQKNLMWMQISLRVNMGSECRILWGNITYSISFTFLFSVNNYFWASR